MIQYFLYMEGLKRNVSLAPLLIGGIVLIPLEQKLLGYSILGLGASYLAFMPRVFARHMILVYIAIAILGITPISTDISFWHLIVMGTTIATAVAIPFIVTRYLYKDEVIKFPFHKHTWTRQHIGYLVLAGLLSYLILPLWMQSTSGYLNWTVPTDPAGLFVLFLGTNVLGIWDELFFIVTILALLRRHFPFYIANLTQAVLFTAFLYELGFRDWMPLVIYPFALLQGLIFRKTDNLAYIIAIHLVIDFVLYLALINAHHPHLVNIFIRL